MYLYDPIVWDNGPPTQQPAVENKQEEPKIDLGVDFSFFTSDAAKNIKDDTPSAPSTTTPKKRTRKSSTKNNDTNNKSVDVTSDYSASYDDTNNLLRSSIAQTDILSAEIKSDIDSVRASKTIKNKYTYITDLTGTAASLIDTKIRAISEINKSIGQAHRFNLDREKIMKDSLADNDDAKIMDLYSAFVNAPMGVYTPPNVPNIQDSILGVNSINPNIGAVTMVNTEQSAPSLTPEQFAMRMESNPNIITVVKYNSETGQRFFDIIDRNTGETIHGIPRPDNFLLEDTTIDIHAGIARNRNLDRVWPLIEISPAITSEY